MSVMLVKKLRLLRLLVITMLELTVAMALIGVCTSSYNNLSQLC